MLPRSRSAKAWAVDHTCFLSISCTIPDFALPPDMSTDQLKESFKKLISENKIEGMQSIGNVTYVDKHQKHQCFINFSSEKNAKQAVAVFKEVEIHKNIKLDSSYRPPQINNQMASLAPSCVNNRFKYLNDFIKLFNILLLLYILLFLEVETLREHL